jgi:hypothetical protein
MKKIKEIRPLKENSQIKNIEHLFIMYYKNRIKKDCYLEEMFFNIVRQITKVLKIQDDKLFLNSKEIVEYDLYLKDRLGKLQREKVVKTMQPDRIIYEIRVNETHIKHRILFFPYTVLDDGILVFCYGFSKTKNKYTHTGIDLTSTLLENTREIKNLFANSTNIKYFLANEI